MFITIGISSQKAYEFTDDIIQKSSEIIKFNFELINQKYSLILEEEAKIISSYTCESKNPYYRVHIKYLIDVYVKKIGKKK